MGQVAADDQRDLKCRRENRAHALQVEPIENPFGPKVLPMALSVLK